MNYKIKVNNEAESKEVQELFFELGYRKNAKFTKEDFIDFGGWICALDDGSCDYCPTSPTDKELTIQQIKDLVVLKRNDRKDANVSEENCLYDLYLTESKELYFYHCGKNKWILSNLNGDDDYYESLNPIEKLMKEYLRKNSNGTYSYIGTVRPEHVSDFVIEIPGDAEKATLCNGYLIFWRNEVESFSEKDGDESWMSGGDNMSFSEYMIEHDDISLVWQRHTQPEELPFVDDASINDQYAEIEKVRQNSKLDQSISDFKNTDHGKEFDEFDLMADAVNHPPHYASGEIECIDAMRAMLGREQFIGYIRGNMFKYQWRYQNKNGIEDLKKSEWYLNKLLEVENEL